MQKTNEEPKTVYDFSKMSREEIEQLCLKLATEKAQVEAERDWYLANLKLSNGRVFGKSSEANIPGQINFEDLGIFNEAEADRDPINIEPKLEPGSNSSDKKSAKKNSRRKNTKALEIERTDCILSGDVSERKCPECGGQLYAYDTRIVRLIETIPAKTFVHEYVVKEYRCEACGNIVDGDNTPVPVIERSCASAELIADIICKKYELAIPFDRLDHYNKQVGIPVTKNNMCNWTIKVAYDWLKLIRDRMCEIQYAGGVIHCDETHTQILSEEGKPAESKSYIWVTTTPTCYKDKPIALYNYTRTRSSSDAREVLKGYSGYIMCDGYQGYDALKKPKNGEDGMDVILVACLVHVRRKFVEALKLVKKNERAGTGANLAIAKLHDIFALDNKFNDMSIQERYEARQKYLKPHLDDFFEWVESEIEITLPKSKYGKALEYAYNQKEKVMNVLYDGRLEIENNMAERAVKPFVIGRKNWLFSESPAGAEASCICYSIVQTAKMNNLIPYHYITYLLKELPKLA
ncbi:MAG: IS66 family transposase, partial [Pseudobutyrivibrio sp.]|nr:IS66 family transposase [Pseudobutyrivibrio sp.]